MYCVSMKLYFLNPLRAYWHTRQKQDFSTAVGMQLVWQSGSSLSVFHVIPPLVFLQVVFGHPHFSLGVHLNVVFTILSSFRKIWPIHLCLLVVSKSSMLIYAVSFRSSLLEIFCGQNICMMFRRHVVWLKIVSDLFQSYASILNHTVLEWTDQ